MYGAISHKVLSKPGMEEENIVPAYVVLTLDVSDSSAYADYRERAPQLAEAYGGKLLGRGDLVEVVGGEAPSGRRRVIAYEFDTLDQAREWHNLPNPSPEQAEIRALRGRVGASTVSFVDGNL